MAKDRNQFHNCLKLIAPIGTMLVMAFPLSVLASIFISEIAWMGTADSPSNEWLELHNMSEISADLTGWILRIENVKDIPLSGQIGANGFYLIERTDDNTVPQLPADLISSFGRGISNSGGSIVLMDQNGNELDRISGGENWINIGGDNSNKKTAQKGANGWVTADPTPKASNAATGDVPPTQNPAPQNSHPSSNERDAKSTPPRIAPNSSGNSSPQQPNIIADAGEDRAITAGTPVLFEGFATGLQGEPLSGARYLWSFGDGTTAEGKKIEHTFIYPGTYAVSLSISSGEWSDTDRITVRADKANMKIIDAKTGEDGYIIIANEGQRDIDISRWSIVAGASVFYLPQNTFIIGNTDAAFSNSITRLTWQDADAISLRYPNLEIYTTFDYQQKIAGLAIQNKPISAVSQTKTRTAANTDVPQNITVTPPAQNQSNSQDIERFKTAATTSPSENMLASASASSKSGGLLKWLFVLAVIVLLSVISYFAIPQEKKYLAEAFEIIEDKDE